MLLRTLLENDGFDVSEASSGPEVQTRLERDDFALVTLDLNLNGEDGLAIAREVRARHDIPIIMITAKNDDIDRVVGLELGADDYIAKPFRGREVVARVRAVLRRARPANGHGPRSDRVRYGFAGMILDVTGRELTSTNGTPVILTTSEFNLLDLFVRRAGRVLSRDNILDALKGQEWSPLDRSIDTLVGRLRRKIETEPDQPVLIKSIRGVGYLFAAEAHRL